MRKIKKMPSAVSAKVKIYEDTSLADFKMEDVKEGDFTR
jgi:hypothetical protein